MPVIPGLGISSYASSTITIFGNFWLLNTSMEFFVMAKLSYFLEHTQNVHLLSKNCLIFIRTINRFKLECNLEKLHGMKEENQLKETTVLLEFQKLLSNNPSEENVHQFLEKNTIILRFFLSGFPITEGIYGVFSKFPITIDRIPDFTLVEIPMPKLRQYPGQIVFIEIKRPDAKLFTKNGRLSKDLNDAFTECLDNIRLISYNYEDFLRRLVKRTGPIGAKTYKQIKKCINAYVDSVFLDFPQIFSTIVIGRRSTLTYDEIMKVRMMWASTGRAIMIFTYDALLDFLKSRTDENASPKLYV
jgi:hypothetical protein